MKKFFGILVISSIVLTSCTNSGTTDYDTFAQCLTDSGTIMFGASWCPHCADQKIMFKRSAKNIPYFECSPNGSSQPQAEECAERQIISYPTWQFPEEVLSSLGDSVWKPLYEAQVTARRAQNADLEIPGENDDTLNFFEKYQQIPGAYNQGRLGGTKTLEELALFSGCFDALEEDRSSFDASEENQEEVTTIEEGVSQE